MKCFYSGADAVGVCQACGRGLSLAHLTEFPLGLACKGRCEKSVEGYIRILEENIQIQEEGTMKKILSTSGQGLLVNGIITVCMGVAFVVWGKMSYSLFIWIGAGFLVLGGYNLIRAWIIRAR